MNRRNKSGFTLIELLVVVSIITLLISLLLPTVGEVRRQARISNCAQNMKQHSIALLAYAASNDDEFVNAPKSPGGTGFTGILGPRGRTAFRMAGDDFELNGFAWGTNGVRTLTAPYSIDILNPTALDDFAGIHNMYWMTLAQYIDDGLSGGAAFNDAFISPSHEVARQDWNDARNSLRDLGGVFPSINQAGTLSDVGVLDSGSYHYVTAAVTTPKMTEMSGDYSSRNSDYTQYVDGDDGGTSYPLGTGGALPGEFNHFMARNRIGDMRFASQKVVFYLKQPWHNPDLFGWFQDGADTTIALGDGSARNADPQGDAAPINYLEDSGSGWPVVFVTETNSNFPETAVYPGAFWHTNGGIRGRDIR